MSNLEAIEAHVASISKMGRPSNTSPYYADRIERDNKDDVDKLLDFLLKAEHSPDKALVETAAATLAHFLPHVHRVYM